MRTIRIAAPGEKKGGPEGPPRRKNVLALSESEDSVDREQELVVLRERAAAVHIEGIAIAANAERVIPAEFRPQGQTEARRQRARKGESRGPIRTESKLGVGRRTGSIDRRGWQQIGALQPHEVLRAADAADEEALVIAVDFTAGAEAPRVAPLVDAVERGAF